MSVATTSIEAPTGAAAPQAADPYLELAELAGRLVHELKNHLGSLALNLQLLTEDLQDPQSPRQRRALQRAEKLQHECQRLTDISTDFLRFARLQELTLAPAHLSDVIQELVDFYEPSARQAGIEVRVFLPADLPPIRLDADLFKQALLNLLLNAAQAMPQGGEITIQAERQDREIKLQLIDTGVGMKPEVMAQIFRPFYSTRAGGTGLGLPTTKRIIELHGGRIEVQSEEGRGTMFTITLPATQERT
jgi:signal transduction histidine kinase